MKLVSTFLAAVAILFAAGAAAHPGHDESAPASLPGARGEFMRNLDAAGTKLVRLAEAVPADKYTWRPAEGVRSFSEVFLHAAAANYLFPTFLGVESPDKRKSSDLEKSTTRKEEVIAILKQSLDHLKQAATTLPDSELETRVKWFLGETTKRETLFFVAAHNHEHLGQAIAYARMNGITPPWNQ
jgi:uncharacterized damage-inducible protein DinB